MDEVPEQARLVAVAEALFARSEPPAAPGDEPRAELRTTPLPDDDAVCVYRPTRGGGRIFVARDETVLFVGSALDHDRALAAFRAGRRTPTSAFEPRD